MTAEEYQRALDRTGGQVVPLAEAERWALLQEWRRVFAVWLHAATGRWKQQFEWDVFCGEYARALNAEKAAAAYAAEHPAAVIVCPESGVLPAVRLQGGELPSFRVEADDVYVWPPDLSWTMAFTHEEDLGLGPYFSRQEWVASGPGRVAGRRPGPD